MAYSDFASPSITMIAPFPPPTHGAGKNSQRILEDLSARGVKVEKLNTNPTGLRVSNSGIRYHLKRVARLVQNLKRLTGSQTVYLVPDGGAGILYSALYVTWARFTGATSMFLHHRNYSHIDRYSYVMKFICLVGGDVITHVFLDGLMGHRFVQIYGDWKAMRVVSNAATNDVRPFLGEKPDNGQKINIGFLSNLTIEKGFDDVARLFLELHNADSCYDFYLAGEPVSQIEQGILDKLLVQLGDRLKYTGAIYGQEKEKFFREVDVFLFPTKYRKEAQPNVIYEAFASGCIVIATARACIPCMCEAVFSKVVDVDVDFTQHASDFITQLEVGDIKQLKKLIVQQYLQLQVEAVQQYEELLDVLCNAGKRCFVD